MLDLKNITLVAVATTEVEATGKALEYSLRGARFEKVLLVSPFHPLPATQIAHVKIDKFRDVGEWGRYVVFELHQHIETEHIVLIHADGFVVNPESWIEDFRAFDYIGAPWPLPRDSFSYRDYYGN